MSSPRRARVVVVGGGISGLAATHALVEGLRGRVDPADVLLCEASGRLGGTLRTVREGAWLIEAGPDSLVTRKPAGVELCRELGLGDQLVAARPARPAAQVVRGGRLYDLPEGVAMAMPAGLGALLRDRLYSPLGKARLLAERWVEPRRDGGEETLQAFVTRRLGREAFERVVEPVIGSLFTGDAAGFATQRVAPRLVELEARWGSLTAGASAERRAAHRASAGGGGNGTAPPAQVTLRGGMDELVRALAERLEGRRPLAARAGAAGARVSLETGVEALAVRRREGDRGFLVELEGRDPVACEALVLAVPGGALARLLRPLDADIGAAAARAAGSLAYAASATVGLAYPGGVQSRALRGLGVFVPRTEGCAVLAVSYASEKFPDRAPPGHLLLRAFVGGALHPEVLERDDDEIVALAHRRVAAWLGIDRPPELARVHRHAEGIPQLVMGSDAGSAALRAGVAEVPGLAVAGSALGLYGIADCVASGRQAAAAVLRALDGAAAR